MSFSCACPIVYREGRNLEEIETASCVFHPHSGGYGRAVLSLTARGRQPREMICDLDWGWGNCEEASPRQVGNQSTTGGWSALLCFEV
uniref:Uncharacterized protein n=1 Tax=Setaria italica TaxID=4555 RepID=K4AHA7_SETIT